jgi:hypothetical protein
MNTANFGALNQPQLLRINHLAARGTPVRGVLSP